GCSPCPRTISSSPGTGSTPPSAPSAPTSTSGSPGAGSRRRIVTDPRARAADELERARARTLALLDPIPDAALVAQHSELMSPLAWDLAHIGHYEELWLLREL